MRKHLSLLSYLFALTAASTISANAEAQSSDIKKIEVTRVIRLNQTADSCGEISNSFIILNNNILISSNTDAILAYECVVELLPISHA